ncbi:beta-ketoacyl synthase N-terminal-like domain-containing protein [Streptomyces sp. TS71-3]|uniref:beta-ketoacyl synthase N-terminal-like domain-containing protein n=1 Tax=Streptomyces sp. TS71-3 TaxID=2733862 RepID=UPI001B0AE148|nr:beta-ketoacyl synthase N-terminal-like domain-containing protein [Streptomyces sp. TS71-3]GHJ35625.1 hypothetical protein Sm713_12340 [Streptomyces sp. TS71-3]
MKRLLLDFLWSHLHSLGAFGRPEPTVGAAREAAGLPPGYGAWFAESVRVLDAEGYVERHGDTVLTYRSPRPRPLAELWRQWEAAAPRWRGNPDLAATHLLVETVLRAFPDILTGERPATEVMFPGASMELVEKAYKSNPAAEYFNRVLAATLVTHLGHRTRAQPGFAPKILEIGAGTGATSAAVLDALRSKGLALREYAYTDLSRAFLDHAERSYGPANPFLTYGILDIERAPAGQGFPAGGYDVVLAANVLHATRNIRTTLRNTKAALARGGLLLVDELTVNNLVNQFTFGLLDGWWRYEDPETRIPGSPLLSVGGWRRVLAEEGFGRITLPARQAADLGRQIIVAESNGVVRQGRAPSGDSLRHPVPDSLRHPVPEAAERPEGGAPVPADPAAGRAPAEAGGERAPGDRLAAHVEATVLDVLAESLRIDRSRIDRDEPFSSYGLDSIFAVNVARAVGEKLDVDLDITVLFEHGTLAELVGFVTAEFASELRAALPPDTTPGPGAPGRGGRAADPGAAPAAGGGGAGTVAAAGSEPEADSGAEADPGAEAVPEGMAIVGMSGRFPGAGDVDEFWRIVEDGRRCITTPPMGREDWALHGDGGDDDGNGGDGGDGRDASAIWGGFLDGVHAFDPLFFSMSMTEARQVAPELRLMLMTAWNAIEDAGYRPADLRTRPTGVFIAAGPSEYRPGPPDGGDGPSLTGMPSPAMIPNRISYLLDLHGPSEQCDTTCSSSLVALHRAVRSIRDGECDQALVGGVNLVMSPDGFAGMRAAGMLSSSGNVRPFQEDADGTVRGEGVGAVLVKPLARAIEDGDFVYGVVRGTGVAHGGKGVSFTAPNIRGMKSAIARAYADAGIDPGTVSYVEAHGMSSLLADGAEIAALGAGLRGDAAAPASAPEPAGEDGSAVYLGSVKPCIGHTEVVSGLAALMKTVQAMRHGVIPAIPGFGRPHPDISLEGTRLRLATRSTPWPVRTGDGGRRLPRRAGVNSFGIGGVNAHVVLEEYVPAGTVRDVEGTPARDAEGASARDAENVRAPHVLVLSARTGTALRERARRLAERLAAAGPESLADIAYTLQTGREAMECRLALTAATGAEAAAALGGWLRGEPETRARVSVAGDARGDRGTGDTSSAGGAGNDAGQAGERQAGHAREDPEEVVRSLVAQGRMDLLAERWAAGAPVDWSLLHRGERRRRVPLPGYPFEQRTCFSAQAPARTPLTGGPAPEAAPMSTSGPAPASEGGSGRASGPEDFVAGLVASVLGLGRQEIDGTKSLADYGLNSLLMVALLSRLREVFPAFQPDWLQVDDTLDDVVARLSAVAAATATDAEGGVPAAPATGPRFPELVHLNGVTRGRPVFWIHGALAGVETFRSIAARIDRPFYGIQARGFMTEHAPIEGIPAMAAYYRDIVRAVQPEGPYDIGGFCLGGIVSYEMTRLLQNGGQDVRSLLMVDSPDNTGWAKSNESGNASALSAALQVVNSLLWPAGARTLAEVRPRLIHQDEVAGPPDEADLVPRLADLAVERGLSMGREQIADFVRRNIRVQLAYRIGEYGIRPLVRPDAVRSLYFRNRRGLFLGELDPYFTVAGEDFSLDHVNYWQDWERELPGLRVVDIDSANHMTILQDDGPLARITQAAVETYARDEDGDHAAATAPAVSRE